MQCLDFMQQGNQSIGKGVKGLGGPGCVQGGHSQSTTKQEWGGKSDIRNTNPNTTNGCYHCGNTDHILPLFSYLAKKHRLEIYIQMKKQRQDKKKNE